MRSCCVAIVTVVFASASAQPDSNSAIVAEVGQAAQSSLEAERAQLVSKLIETRVTLHLEDVQARDAFKALRQAGRLPLIGRYRDDSVGFGLDSSILISIDVVDQPAIDALED